MNRTGLLDNSADSDEVHVQSRNTGKSGRPESSNGLKGVQGSWLQRQDLHSAEGRMAQNVSSDSFWTSVKIADVGLDVVSKLKLYYVLRDDSRPEIIDLDSSLRKVTGILEELKTLDPTSDGTTDQLIRASIRRCAWGIHHLEDLLKKLYSAEAEDTKAYKIPYWFRGKTLGELQDTVTDLHVHLTFIYEALTSDTNVKHPESNSGGN